jgi:hypothetical protein
MECDVRVKAVRCDERMRTSVDSKARRLSCALPRSRAHTRTRRTDHLTSPGQTADIQVQRRLSAALGTDASRTVLTEALCHRGQRTQLALDCDEV